MSAEPSPYPGHYQELEAKTCPCCGQHMPEVEMRVDLNSNTFFCKGTQYQLSPKMAEFLFALIQARPEYVTDVSINIALWGMADCERDRRTSLSTYASVTNKMLHKHGFHLWKTVGRGYRIGPMD